MADEFEKSFQEFLDNIPPREGPYEPGSWYNDTGDILNVMWSDESYYARWLNHRVTLLISQETDKVIGCEV